MVWAPFYSEGKARGVHNPSHRWDGLVWPLCLVEVLVAYMLVVYSFFFNLLVSRLGSRGDFDSNHGVALSHLHPHAGENGIDRAELATSPSVWIRLILVQLMLWPMQAALARQFCGIYTALAADIQGYAMPFGQNSLNMVSQTRAGPWLASFVPSAFRDPFLHHRSPTTLLGLFHVLPIPLWLAKVAAHQIFWEVLALKLN